MMHYLDELNEVQRKAVSHGDGPVLVIAGPGSGKTRVLTYRIAYLIESGVEPESILALTFTNKAAKEMKERIQKVVGERANKVWAGTFHSIFARLLRAEATKIGYPSDFAIYDTSDAKSALSELVKTQGLDGKVYTANMLYGRISLSKNNLITPQQYAADSQLLMEDKRNGVPYIYKIYDLYQKKLQRAGAMDFDDLLFQMHRLLKENPEGVLDKYRRRFRHVLVDEFQDTNQLQYGIIQLLVHYPGSTGNIYTVGDDAQSIYAFRGATIQNILDFEKDYPQLSIYKLEQNYRSTPVIVQAANDVISHNRRQLKKTIFTDKSKGEPITVLRAITEEDEAKSVVARIRELKNRHQLDNDDFAILYRINAQSRVFEEALKLHRIPYKIYGGMSFYERKEIKDSIAYLRVLLNPNDEEALKRIINYPARGIGDTTTERLQQIASREGCSLWEAVHRAVQYPELKSAVRHLQGFVQIIETLRSRVQYDNAYEVAERTVRMAGILEDLKKDKTPEGQSRIENVQELLDGIKAFVENDELGETQPALIADKSLTTYIQNVILLTDLSEEAEEQPGGRVKLMSVHAAKGLEFKAVFITGMEENLFPSGMALREKNQTAAIEEERRLFYVAITRAEQFLTLSYATGRYQFGKMVYNQTSRFLEEVPSACLDMEQAGGVGSGSGNRINALRPLPRKQERPTDLPKAVANFQPSPSHKVVAGVRVAHERFGTGKVVSVEGEGQDRIATVLFDEAGEKRILLKFAKLQVLS